MSTVKVTPLGDLVRDAVQAGVLPANVALPVQDVRPWPVVLMTALGAWLAALPLVLALGFMLGSFLEKGGGTYVVALLALGLAVMLIRPRGVSLFVEQIGVPCLLVGGGLLGYALFRDMDNQLAAVALGAVCLAFAAILPRDWLRVLLGLVACGLLAVGSVGSQYLWSYDSDAATLYLAWLLALGVWLGAHWLQKSTFDDGKGAAVAGYIESVSTGWVLAILLGLASWSGKTFLLSASVGDGLGDDMANALNRHGSSWYAQWLPFLSVLLAVAAAAWMLRCWPSLRQLPAAGVALVLTGLAWFLPGLGPVMLILAFCVSSARLRVAVAAGVAAAWIIGSFYYLLAWPLASKALVLAAAGLVLGLMSVLAARGAILPATGDLGTQPSKPGRKAQLGMLAGLLLVLVVGNGAIWQKEQLIANGAPVLVALEPVDPRSLMQGDYMTLNFLSISALNELSGFDESGKRPHVVLTRDERGVASVKRVDDGTPLAPGEYRMQLTRKAGRWTLVSDAWFFKEGEGEHFGKARYGEFRVMPDGRALLVGMRDENLAPL
ncbi:GDYXXLXY domain-containing protein [Janthinobacterium sp. RB2R34]|uniref:GDYXXLXY domain-containing protein n=1 Tax=Janthinobacterium sp. RB2R34 TaxID=3424193 RepID=UPI003F211BDA